MSITIEETVCTLAISLRTGEVCQMGGERRLLQWKLKGRPSLPGSELFFECIYASDPDESAHQKAAIGFLKTLCHHGLTQMESGVKITTRLCYLGCDQAATVSEMIKVLEEAVKERRQLSEMGW